MDYKIEKIPQYKQGDMIILTKFKPEWGFHDDPVYNPKLYTPYKVAKFEPRYAFEFNREVIYSPVVILDRDYEAGYPNFGDWWIPVEIITHAKSMAELTKIIMDKVKSVKGENYVRSGKKD